MHTPATHISCSSLLLTSVGGVFARVVVVVGEDRDRCAAFILSLYAVHNATPILINYYYYSSKNNVNRFLPVVVYRLLLLGYLVVMVVEVVEFVVVVFL